MAYSYNSYGAKGSGDSIVVGFPFLAREHVRVSVDGVDYPGYDPEAGSVGPAVWEWVNDGLISCTLGFPVGTATRVYRETPIGEPMSALVATAVLDYGGINETDLQLLYAVQELQDRMDTEEATSGDLVGRVEDLEDIDAEVRLHALEVAAGPEPLPGGLVGDGVTDDTLALQAAIDAASAIGGEVILGPHTYGVSAQGTHNGFLYGIMLKSNMKLRGSASGLTVIRALNNSNMNILITDNTSPTENLHLQGFTVDGNSANQPLNPEATNNIKLYDVDGLTMDDVESVDPALFGFFLEKIENFRYSRLRAICGANGADAIHLYDHRYGVIDGAYCQTKSDDHFIITAYTRDVHDIIADGIICEAGAGATNGRGVLLNLSDAAVALATQRKMYNITVNATTHNIFGTACQLYAANFSNVTINLKDYGSTISFYPFAGATGIVGTIRQCEFNIQSQNTAQQAMTSFITANGSAIEDNKLNLLSYNPSAGANWVGATIFGSRWEGVINVDYNPLVDKGAPLYAVDFWGSDNRFRLTLQGAGTNLNMRAGASRNTFDIGRLSDAVTCDIAISATANDNTFTGGNITGAILDSGTRTQFLGGGKFSGYGAATVTTNVNGVGDIVHGLAGTPRSYWVQATGDNTYEASVQAIGATLMTVRIRDTTTNADKASSTQDVVWGAFL